MQIRIIEMPECYVGLKDIKLPVEVEVLYIKEGEITDVAYVSYEEMQKIPGFYRHPTDRAEGEPYVFDRKDSVWHPLRSIADLIGEEGLRKIIAERERKGRMKELLKDLLDDYSNAVYELAVAETLDTTDWDEVSDKVKTLRAEIEALLVEAVVC